MSDNKIYFAPILANDLGINFTDKRNRNPNWTDNEIIRFLEILQEENVMADLASNKNKQVWENLKFFCFRLTYLYFSGVLLCFSKISSRRL